MSELGRAVARLWRSSPASASAYEQVTRERADGLARQLGAIEVKINALFLTVLAGALGELWRIVHP